MIPTTMKVGVVVEVEMMDMVEGRQLEVSSKNCEAELHCELNIEHVRTLRLPYEDHAHHLYNEYLHRRSFYMCLSAQQTNYPSH